MSYYGDALVRLPLIFLLLFGVVLGAISPSMRWFFKYSSLPSPGTSCNWVREETPIRVKWLQIQSPNSSVNLTFEVEGATKECALSDGRKQRVIVPANVYQTFTKDESSFTQVSYKPVRGRSSFGAYMEQLANDQAGGDILLKLLLERGVTEDRAWFVPSKNAFIVARQINEDQYQAFYFYTGIVNGKPNIYLRADKTAGVNTYDFRSLVGMIDLKDLGVATIEKRSP